MIKKSQTPTRISPSSMTQDLPDSQAERSTAFFDVKATGTDDGGCVVAEVGVGVRVERAESIKADAEADTDGALMTGEGTMTGARLEKVSQRYSQTPRTSIYVGSGARQTRLTDEDQTARKPPVAQAVEVWQIAESARQSSESGQRTQRYTDTPADSV